LYIPKRNYVNKMKQTKQEVNLVFSLDEWKRAFIVSSLNWQGCIFGLNLILMGWFLSSVITPPWQIFPQMIMLLGIGISIRFIGITITKMNKRELLRLILFLAMLLGINILSDLL